MFDARYERDEVLGSGGMGDVLLCRDRELGRQVAVKVSKASSAISRDKFIREARIQSQLEHPAIVPVYDFGTMPDGQPYFVMKRVLGTPLKEILRRLHEGDPSTVKKYTRNKLLGAFVSVCRAVDFAHSRMVIHRDLKPANIMLGEFGEVYVLDWGIVKLVGESEPGGRVSPDDDSIQTTDGGVFGTPLYMAPEQVHGEMEAISVGTDVWALGAVLFEILTLAAMKSKKAPSLRSNTLAIPPELVEVCERALETEIAKRWPSAREMAEAVERYLEGDRDVAARQKAAAEHLERARQAMTRAGEPSSNEHEERARALRNAARAMALSPNDEEATRAVLRVLLEPARSLPAEAARDLEEEWIAARKLSSKLSVFSSVVVAALIGFGTLLGVRDWRLVGLAMLMTLSAAYMGVLGMVGRPKGRGRYVVLACWLGLALILTRLFGPLILIPTIAGSILVPMLLSVFDSSRMVVAIGLGIIPCVTLLELLGVIPSSYVFAADMMCIQPQLVSLPKNGALALLFAAQMGALSLMLQQVVRIRDRHFSAEKRLRLQGWYLARLVG